MGKALIITAPSGAGKTTLVKMLLESRNNLAFSVSACTRQKRENETHGKDYYFLKPDEFRAKIANNEFAEWEEVYQDMFYGTLQREIERIWDLGKTVIFDIDVKGALSLKEKLGDKALSIFITPPSKETLKQRLLGRGTENEESFQKRFNKSVEELGFQEKMDTTVINDDLQTAFKELNQKIDAFV